MSGKRRLRKSVDHLNIRKVDRVTEIPALLGLTLGGSYLVDVPNRSGYVYARMRDNLNEVVQAYNSQVSPVYDLPVLLVRDQVDRSRYIVKGRDLGRYQDWGDSAYLPRHWNQHSFDPASPGADIIWIYDKQWMPFAIIPSGSSGGPNVLTKDTLYWQDSDWHALGYTGSANILTYKPTGSWARLVLVYADDDANPQLVAGSFFNASWTGASQIVNHIPDLPNSTTDYPLGVVRLVSGTSKITWDNIYRTFMVGGGGGGGVTGMITGSVLFAAADGTATEDNPHFFYDNTNDMLIVGSNQYPVSTTPQIAAVNNGAAASAILSYGSIPFFSTYRANNVEGIPSGVVFNDVFGRWVAGGYAAGAWQAYANAIQAVATENWAAGKLGSQWEIYANVTGTASPRKVAEISGERFKINNLLSIGAAQSITINDRTITLSPPASHYRIFTTGGASNLDTIYGGNDGDLIWIEHGAEEGQTITIQDVAVATHPDANLYVDTSVSYIMPTAGQLICFMYSSFVGVWMQFGANNF